MNDQNHLIFSVLQGTAELDCPEYGLKTSGLQVNFYPENLNFELYLDETDPLVEALAYERRAVHLWLRQVQLVFDNGCRTLQAEAFCLTRKNALSEWPEAAGGLLTNKGAAKARKRKRRLLLAPAEQCLEFQCEKPFPTPYQIYYADACSGIGAPSSVEHTSLSAPVALNAAYPQTGYFCAHSKQDFFAQEARLHVALAFIHGRKMPIVCEVRNTEIRFYGTSLRTSVNYIPSSKERGFAYMQAVVNGFLNLSVQAFEAAKAALQFHLAGKQSEVFLEGRYMLLMTCLESIDGLRQLRVERTSAMLGVSADAAKLINGMRHEFVHGKGGYECAYEAFQADEKSTFVPENLEEGMAGCIHRNGTLNFVQLWMRLYERLDAFWCAYLGLSAELQNARYAPLPLMPAVNQDACSMVPPQRTKSNESIQLTELNKKIQRLKSEKEKRDVQLKKQGQLIEHLKLGLDQSLNEHHTKSVLHEVRVDSPA